MTNTLDKLRIPEPTHEREPFNPVALGIQVRETRLILGLTIDQVAEEVGCSRDTIARFERGERLTEDGLWALIAWAVGGLVGKGQRPAKATR